MARQYSKHGSPEESGNVKHAVLKIAQLMWTGHVIRMPDERLPKKVVYEELQEGKCSRGQKKRYKDTLKASLKDFNIPIGPCEQTAHGRLKWQGLINTGAALYEKRESVKLKESAENAKPVSMGHQLTP